MTAIKFYVLFIIGIFMWSPNANCFAQTVTDSAYFSTYTPISYVSVLSQNDLYQKGNGGDKYYSNGIHFEFAHSLFSKWPSKYILPELSKTAFNEYSILLSQEIHTPYNISRTSVATNDRPYCGLLYITLANQSNNFNAGRKLKSKFYLGVIGPASGAEQLQNWVHKNISHSIPANGWTHQIANGLMLDYEVILEQRLPIPTKYVEFTVSAEGHIGSIHNYVQAGTHLKIGLFNSSFLNMGGTYNNNGTSPKAHKVGKDSKRTAFTNRTIQVYGFIHVDVGYQFYDGTVQGSLISFNDSPYTFEQERLNHTHNMYKMGMVISYKAFQIAYALVRTPDIYKNDGLYGWGEISLLYSL